MLSPHARRAGRWLMVAVAVLGAGHLILHLFPEWFEALPAGVGRWPDLNSESSIGTWFNAGLLLVVGVGAVLAVQSAGRGRPRAAWTAIAAVALLLSLDEKISIHERLPQLLGMTQGTLATHEWLVPGVVLAVIGVAVLVLLGRSLPRPVGRGLTMALVIYLCGAVAIEAVTGVGIRALPVEHPFRAAMPLWELVEEGLEMLGCILALMVVMGHLERSGTLRLDQAVEPPGAQQPATTNDRSSRPAAV